MGRVSWNQKTHVGGGMDNFWNYTIQLMNKIERVKYDFAEQKDCNSSCQYQILC